MDTSKKENNLLQILWRDEKQIAFNVKAYESFTQFLNKDVFELFKTIPGNIPMYDLLLNLVNEGGSLIKEKYRDMVSKEISDRKNLFKSEFAENWLNAKIQIVDELSEQVKTNLHQLADVDYNLYVDIDIKYTFWDTDKGQFEYDIEPIELSHSIILSNDARKKLHSDVLEFIETLKQFNKKIREATGDRYSGILLSDTRWNDFIIYSLEHEELLINPFAFTSIKEKNEKDQ